MALGIVFRHHPDGHIIIGDVLMDVAEFVQIWPTYSGLPTSVNGMANGDMIIGREYIPGSRHSLFTKGGAQLGGEYPWAEGDAITDAFDQIVADLNTLRNPPETLDEAKVRRVVELTGDFERSFAGGFTCSNGITMDATKEHITQLDDGYRLVLRGGGATLQIRDFNNVNHTLALTDVDTMIIELGQNWQTQLYRLWAAKDAVKAATTIADVDAVTF